MGGYLNLIVFLALVVLTYILYKLCINLISFIINKITHRYRINYNRIDYVIIGGEKLPIFGITQHKNSKELFWIKCDGKFHYTVIDDMVYVVSFNDSLLYYSGTIKKQNGDNVLHISKYFRNDEFMREIGIELRNTAIRRFF